MTDKNEVGFSVVPPISTDVTFDSHYLKNSMK